MALRQIARVGQHIVERLEETVVVENAVLRRREGIEGFNLTDSVNAACSGA